jgi:RND family efflux transporter MFP subunit
VSPSDPDSGEVTEGALGAEAPDVATASWAELRAPSSPEAFYQAWLTLQCGMVPDVLGGLVLIGPAERGPFAPVAVWPRLYGDLKPLTSAAERVMSERRGLVLQAEGAAGRAPFQAAQPIEVEGSLCGAVVLDLSARPEEGLAHALRQLGWGTSWIETWLRRQAGSQADTRSERMQTLLRLVAAVPERDRFRAAATHLATEAATQLACDRVSIGFVHGQHVGLEAMSHSAQFGARSNLVRAIEAAMDEALEQERSIVYPPSSPDDGQVAQAHAALAQEFGSGAVCSVPLVRDAKICGVLQLERGADRPFDSETLALAEAAGALAGPMLELQRSEERWLWRKALESLRGGLEQLFGPHHVVLKLVACALAAVFLFFVFARGDYRVTARTVLEPEVQRAAVAPFDGYLAEAPSRAGDLVQEGDLLARLDDRDLELERLSSRSEVEQLTKQNRQALAARDAAEVRILTASILQARARLDLIEDRLARTQVRAPFDGVIVLGDLSQSLGAPVSRGDALFEIAPLDAYRVVLEVDESDIREIAVSQRGDLVLSAAPQDPLGFAVKTITPVSEAFEGRNYFRVEAEFDRTPENLRPGMEGVGKIEIDRRRLIWIWTHAAADWVRLAAWRWLP